MVPLKERLSLDWLNEVHSRLRPADSVEPYTSKQVEGPPGLEDALLAYGNRLLRAIQKSPAKTARLHELVTGLSLSLPDALPVVQYLVQRGHLRKLEDDPLGNYLLYLTDQGEQLVS